MARNNNYPNTIYIDFSMSHKFQHIIDNIFYIPSFLYQS